MYRATRFAALMLFVSILAGCPNRNPDIVRVTGEIESRHTTAGSRIGGRVMEVLAEEGDTVEKGAILIQLDDAEARALVAAAEANLAGQAAVLVKLETGALPSNCVRVRRRPRRRQPGSP